MYGPFFAEKAVVYKCGEFYAKINDMDVHIAGWMEQNRKETKTQEA